MGEQAYIAEEPQRSKHYRFRLTAAARTLTPRDIDRLTDEEAEALFERIRFSENGGKPYCPHCGVDAVYRYKARKEFKCKACEKRFTVTSGTAFHSRKKSLRDILYAMADFVTVSQGAAAAQVMMRWGLSYKAAFVWLHKFREAMASMQSENILSGEVEVDGVFVGGYIRQPNMIAHRKKGQHKAYNARRRCFLTVRERRLGGRSRSIVLKTETEGRLLLENMVQPDAHVITDAGDHWHRLGLLFAKHSMVTHSEGYSIEGVHINGPENQHSRVRRAERGVYMTLNKAHAQNYADELSWRDDHRLTDTKRQFTSLSERATKMRKRSGWVGYWRSRAYRAARRAAQSTTEPASLLI